MTPAISLIDLKKTYRDGKGKTDKIALKGITLDIPRGSFFGLLGPNGAGKSTIINILAGLTLKTSGKAAIMGHCIDSDVRAARRSIGVVPQELVLDTFFTVREALEFNAGYYGVPKAERCTDEIIAAMGLTDKADVNSRKLSGGMRRRLLIAKALVHAPPVLILDEPTAGVDVELRTSLWNYVRELNAKGTTILLTTHYLEEAQELCDEIAIINHGELVTRNSKQNLMKQFDKKQLILTPAEPVSGLPQALSERGALLSSDGNIRIEYQPSRANALEILAQVQQAGLKIIDVTTEQADLEDIFRHWTQSA